MKPLKKLPEYFSAKTAHSVNVYLERMGLVPVEGGYNSPHESLGYKESKPALYSPKKYADGWGVFVQYFYENTIMRQQNRRMPNDEFNAIFGKRPVNNLVCFHGGFV